VTNGTFDTDSDWTDSDLGSPSASASISGGVINLPRTDGSNYARSYQVVTLDTSKYYELSVEGVSDSTQVRVGNSVANAAVGAITVGSDTGTLLFRPQVAPTYLTLLPQTDGVTSQVDNVSVREINPLSVSIQMDGRMTYADTDAGDEVIFSRWQQSATNLIAHKLSTSGTRTGNPLIVQEADGVADSVLFGGLFDSGVLLPYNIASRHGSTFVNGAVDGTALTENDTPVALPDLSATDLDLGYDYMGTINQFRVWSQDLGDTGIVDATEPSLEPSLSLTFDSTDSSFIVRDFT